MKLVALFLCICCFACQRDALEVAKTNAMLELDNGVLYYQKEPFNGLLVSNFDNGAYKMKLQYRNGRKDGYEKQWYANGQLAQDRTYSKGVKIGRHLGWWEDGTPNFDYSFNARGAHDGSLREWYRNGQLVRDFNYLNGKEIGRQRMWASTGKIKANYEVKNGERFGLIGLKKCHSVKVDSNVLQ